MMKRNWLLWVGCAIMLVAGGLWLWRSGNQNILGFVALLLCPLMHLFMHRGHDHHNAESHTNGGGPENSGAPTEQKRPSCH